MKVERQGHNECILATIAALTETPLREVRNKACVLAGVETDDWNSVVTGRFRSKFWDVSESVSMFFGGPNMWAMVGPMGRTIVPGSTVKRIDPYGMRKLPDKGRGTITVKSTRRGTAISHIMPWKDGMIYDPENPKTPMTFRQYRKIKPRMKVWIVTIEE